MGILVTYEQEDWDSLNNTVREVTGVDGITGTGKKAIRQMTNAVKNYIPNDGSEFVEGTLSYLNYPKLTSVLDGLFDGFSNVKSVNLPVCSSVGRSGFHNCTSLQSIDLPICSYVGTNAFEGCESLQSVNLPMCSSIRGNYVFDKCSLLTNLTLGYSSVVTLTSPIRFQWTPIENSSYTGSFGSIYVPASLVDLYKSATNWVIQSDRITAIVE